MSRTTTPRTTDYLRDATITRRNGHLIYVLTVPASDRAALMEMLVWHSVDVPLASDLLKHLGKLPCETPNPAVPGESK